MTLKERRSDISFIVAVRAWMRIVSILVMKLHWHVLQHEKR